MSSENQKDNFTCGHALIFITQQYYSTISWREQVNFQ
jgi:hypothetical protein